MSQQLRAFVIGMVTLAFMACQGGSTLGHKAGKTLATVNGTPITEGDLDFLGTINPRLKTQAATPFGQKQILDNLVEQELLYQESVKRGLDRDTKVLERADLYRRVIVAQASIDDAIEQEAKKYYDDHKGEFEKIELSHILVKFKSDQGTEKGKAAPTGKDAVTRTEQQALQIANTLKERLAKGEDFAKVAKESSEDAGSKNAGGLLGKVWKQEPRLERRGYGPLLEQAFAMKVGEIGGPIKTQEGYHLITVTKGVEAQNFEEAKQGILFKVQGDIRTKFLADLKAKGKVEYADGRTATEPGKEPTPSSSTPPATPPSAPSTDAAPKDTAPPAAPTK